MHYSAILKVLGIMRGINCVTNAFGKLATVISVQTTCNFDFLSLFLSSTLIMHLLSEYDAFRSSYISDTSDEPLSFFVRFYDIPQINKNIQSSPVYIHFQEKFFMKK